MILQLTIVPKEAAVYPVGVAKPSRSVLNLLYPGPMKGKKS